jgi:hypothetical protein
MQYEKYIYLLLSNGLMINENKIILRKIIAQYNLNICSRNKTSSLNIKYNEISPLSKQQNREGLQYQTSPVGCFCIAPL